MTAAPGVASRAMRVRLDGYSRAHTSLRRRTALLSAAGAVLAIVAAFLGLAMLTAAVSTSKDLALSGEERGLLLGTLGVMTFVTAVPGGVLVWRALVGIGRVRRLRELSLLARRQLVGSSADVATSLNLAPRDAERLVRDAAALGVVEEDAGLADRAGTVLNGTYRLEATLGAGAMGTVHAARHLRTGRAYAVTILRPDARAGDDRARRVEREATAAGALGHPSIVAVHDLDVTPDGTRYLVMDLLRGETLERRLARGPLPFEEARRVAQGLAAALTVSHGAGLLHRDIKPANVFLAEGEGAPPRAVLLDFGLVKHMDEAAASRLTSSGAAIGTPLYMSPEQARGEELDARSDVYALGAVTYEMATGAPPFAGRALADVYARLLTEAAPPASAIARVPAGLDAVLARALAKRREDRFADARAFAEALARVAP